MYPTWTDKLSAFDMSRYIFAAAHGWQWVIDELENKAANERLLAVLTK